MNFSIPPELIRPQEKPRRFITEQIIPSEREARCTPHGLSEALRNELDIHIARLAIWHCAWVLDQGEPGRHASSITKVISSEKVWQVVDRGVQILGGMGVTHETVVARSFADVRAFRIYDGPSETHRWSIANK